MRLGWKAWVAGGFAGLAIAVVSGCGESKEPTKAQTDSSLKPLPAPSSPGGGTTEQNTGKKGAKGTAGSTVGSQ